MSLDEMKSMCTALAHCEEQGYTPIDVFGDPVVYILANEQEQFYDRQIVEVPKGKSVVQIGTFRYESKSGERTVPVIQFE